MKSLTYTTTKQFLINTPLPIQTRTYKPVAHEQLMDLTLEGIHQAGFNVSKELYSSSVDGNVATARYSIGNVADKEMQLQLMWQNSYNKTKKLDFAIGAMVLVCTNGMMSFRAMNAFRKKHVSDIQTMAPQKIVEYIKHSAEVFTVLQSDRDEMKQVEVDRRVTAELLGRMFIEEEFIESTQLNIIKRELNKPTHDYNATGSLWELYNYTTFAIGAIHPGRWMDDHMAAHKFFVEAVELMKSNKTIDVPYELVTEPTPLITSSNDPRIQQLHLYD